jgi:cytochrome c2
MIKALITFVSLLYLSSFVYADEVTVTSPEASNNNVKEVFAPDKERGRKIFATICSHCHRTDHQASAVGAPGLKDVLSRHDPAWIDQWLSGPEEFSKTNDVAKALTESNPYGLIMPTFPEMQSRKNRLDVIEFLKTL